ncbi:MAG: ribosome biogenesis GTPase Der [Puniceicoccales bacterium]|jgi:GTP-binding protein|nr:ribosome biogenesis GTPase Der [Puniceicoccales bacterium]
MEPSYNIVIVGRPNVGKSRLFNRLTRKRISIVHGTAGVTRDVVTHEIGKNITLMDTGGLGLSGDNGVEEIVAAVDDQVWVAVAAANLIFFVVDATDGIMPMDYDIAEKLRKSGTRVAVIANKVDDAEKSYLADVFIALGFGEPIAVSAEHGIGEDKIRALIATETGKLFSNLKSDDVPYNPIKLAFVGRPNVGKSSLVNALLKKERVIVSEIPGTTRESIRIKIPRSTQVDRDFELIDTAGARPQNRITTSIDYFSSLRTDGSVIGSDVTFLVVDATSGITKLDKKIANKIIGAGKGTIVVVNKWDIAQKSHGEDDLTDFQTSFEKAVGRELLSFPGVGVVFTSAQSGYGIDNLLPMAGKLYEKMTLKIGTGELNRVVQRAFAKRQPSTVNGRAFRVYYAVQTGNMPFFFRFFCNQASLLSENYKKYLLKNMRRNFDFAGCSIELEFTEKDRRFSKSKSQLSHDF